MTVSLGKRFVAEAVGTFILVFLERVPQSSR